MSVLLLLLFSVGCVYGQASLAGPEGQAGQASQSDRADTSNGTETQVMCHDPMGSSNCSTKGASYVEAPPSPPAPPMWCPAGYRLMKLRGEWVRACQPMSCTPTSGVISGVTSGPYSTKGPGVTSGVTSEVTSDVTSEVMHCEKMTKNLQSCPKIYLDAGQYLVDAEGSLVDLTRNLTSYLGDYVLTSGRAIVCYPEPSDNSTDDEPQSWAELPRWCMPIAVAADGHRPTSRGLMVTALGVDVALFEVDEDGSAHVCPELDPGVYATCDARGRLPGDEIEVLPNWDIQDHKNILVRAVYPRGEYILAVDGSFAVICIVAGEPLSEGATYAYGAASIFSAFCLLLALLAHLFFPTLNYHARALLCFAFSLFVMYIAVAVRSFSGNFEAPAANLALFSVQYIFGLAAFFWLSILAFDLWRVFADLRGTITPGNTQGKKRIFVAKCVYAWGIPTLLCIVIIALTFSPNIQKSLKLDLHLQSTNWIMDTTTMLIVFYTPISIVLLENVIFFILTIINLRKASSGTDILNKKMNRKLFRVYMKLFLVMGLCWFAEVISWLVVNKTGEAVWYVTDIINCLQGVFIFLIYVCKRKTLLILKSKMGLINSSQMNSFTASTQDRDRKISAISMEAMQKRAAMETSKTSIKNHSPDS